MKHVFFCAVFLFIAGCSEDGPLSIDDPNASFGIYLLEDSTITGYHASQMDISQLVLKDEAWLTDDDIQFYDFSSHCIYLKGDKSQFFDGYTDKHFMFSASLANRVFVVVAGGERCYTGSFHSIVLSSLPPGPYMDEIDVGCYPEDVMHISKCRIDTNDVRSDNRIKNALISLGLYHGGISIELKSVQVIENKDTSTVEYVYKITNNDQDELFVDDPDKMGELFHYFTNGVVLQGNGTLLQSLYKKVIQPSVDWDAAWFTEIPQGASIERTVILKGYPQIPSGNYRCYFYFRNPHVEKENRSLSGGRIWIGETSSDTIQVGIN